MNKNTKRWIPAAVVPVVIVTAAIAVPAAANADPTLPEKSPQQLLELIADSAGTAYSGTVEQSSDMGLPDVSALGQTPGGDSAASALELITGSHTAHVFVGGPTTQRVQVLDRFAERDAIRNGDSVWLYDSKKKEAVHVTAPADADDVAKTSTVTPAEAAQRLLAAIEPSTEIAVVDTARVAGRAAYELRLTPGDADTLVDAVVLSVDAETGLPLGASITAKGQSEPAFDVRFSKISFDAPDASLFEFTPPSDVTVTEETVPGDVPDAASAAHPEPTVVGDGWDAVVVIPAGELPAGARDPMLDRLTTKVDGGRVLSTSLVSVMLADDGRVLVGAVGTETLQAAAAQ